MNLNIDQLDNEERKKINTLLREKHDANKDKGVEYIFREPDERENFLLGKKVDLNKMLKDDKSMMGESEAEFQERMEKRKLMQMVLEDPMSIIQLNEQQARKVALEKKIVHQRLAKKYQSKFKRDKSPSSSDSDASDCKAKLRQLISEKYDDDEDDILGNILSNLNSIDDSQISKTKSKKKSKKKSKYRSRSRSVDFKNRNRSLSREWEHKRSFKTSREEKKDRYSSLTQRKNRSRSRSNDYKYSNKHKDVQSNKTSRYPKSDGKRSFSSERKHKYNTKSKLTKEEIERRLQEMRDNARELSTTVENLDKKIQKQDRKQEEEVEKSLKYRDEYMFKEMVKLNNKNEFSVHNSIKERKKQNLVDKLFKS